MRKLYIFGLIAVALLVIGIAIADEIKFSTYYPAPFGMYREFTTTGKTTLATDEYGIETDAQVGIGTTDPGTAKLAVIGGNVGIGTTSPAEKLVVDGDVNIRANANTGFSLLLRGDNNELIRLGRSDQSGFWDIEIDGNQHFDIGSNSASNIVNITKGGNVGIGTTEPGIYDGEQTQLDVADYAAVDDVYLKVPRSGDPRWASEGGGGGSFGVWNDRDNDGNPDTVALDGNDYFAETSGIVCAYGSSRWIYGYTDNLSHPTTRRVEGCEGTVLNITMPVRRGDYWRVESDGKPLSIYWMPIGN